MSPRWLLACLLPMMAACPLLALAQSSAPPRTYVVEPGDTLWELAERFYGDPLESWRLWMYTPGLINPHRIFPGEIIHIAPLDAEPPSPRITPVPRLRRPRPTTAVAEPGPLWRAHLDVTGQPGTDRSLGGASLVLPLWQDERSLLFLDVRGITDDQDNYEGNIGLAYREMRDSGWNLGGYGFVDVRRSAFDNVFYQATLGAEALSLDWDLRANVYIPLGSSDQRVQRGEDVTFSGFRNQNPELIGGNLAIRTTVDAIGNVVDVREQVLAGIDAEVGYRLPVFPARGDQDLRVFVGGYHFDASGVDAVSGPRARLEYRLYDLAILPTGSRLTAGVEVQRDDPRGTQGFGVLTLRVPLGRDQRVMGARERRMVDPIIRDVDIVSAVKRAVGGSINEEREYLQEALNDGTGQAIRNVVLVDSDQNPAAALSGAGAGTMVVVDDTGGPVLMGNQIIFVEAGQTLVGGGHQLVIRGADDGQTQTYTTPGARPTIESTALDVVSMDSNSYVGGLTVDGGGASTGIGTSSGRSNIHIVDNEIAGSGINGIAIGGNNGAVVVRGNTINLDDNAAGIEVGAGSSGVEIQNNTLSGSALVQGHGISLRQNVRQTLIENNLISGGGSGVVIASQGATDIILRDNTIEDVQQHALHVTGTSGDISMRVDDNRFQGTAGSDLIRIAPGDYSGAGNSSDVVLDAADTLCSRSGPAAEYTGLGFTLTPDGESANQCGDSAP
ncbi:MAG: inverse autotransporter beta domain-containing protein [Aquisalimonadaceae bacterium]